MSKKVLINGKWPLILPESSANEWIGNMKFHHNTWEMPRLLALEKLIKDYIELFDKSPVVLYIGAYKGDMAALLASWGASLMLMESSPGFWPIIRETWTLNKLQDPEVCFSGLASNQTTYSDLDNHLYLWPDRIEEYIEGTTGFSHLAESQNHFPEMTIDDLVERTALIPNIITMDVEGSELEVMKGAIKTIESHQPALVLSVHPEFMFHNHGTYERELHDLVRDRGYVGEWLDYDHEHHWLYKHKESV
jgi:FkbM family methyltransferase